MSASMFQARGKCPHCHRFKIGYSHFTERDAEQNLERQITDCREARVRRGFTVGQTDRPQR